MCTVHTAHDSLISQSRQANLAELPDLLQRKSAHAVEAIIDSKRRCLPVAGSEHHKLYIQRRLN
jgi:hypothetical protein